MTVRGFSLIEILLAILIIGVMATQLPKLTRSSLNADQKFLIVLNSLMRSAQIRALVTNTIQQVYLDLQPGGTLHIRSATDERNTQGDFVFKQIHAPGYDPVPFDQNLEVVRCVIDGTVETTGGDLKTAWFYVMPDGLTQQVLLVVRDVNTGRMIEYVINPLYARFAARFIESGAL